LPYALAPAFVGIATWPLRITSDGSYCLARMAHTFRIWRVAMVDAFPTTGFLGVGADFGAQAAVPLQKRAAGTAHSASHFVLWYDCGVNPRATEGGS